MAKKFNLKHQHKCIHFQKTCEVHEKNGGIYHEKNEK